MDFLKKDINGMEEENSIKDILSDLKKGISGDGKVVFQKKNIKKELKKI